MRPIENDTLKVYVARAFVEEKLARIVPDAAVLSYTTIVPAVPPVTVIVWRRPAPVLQTVVVAVEITVALFRISTLSTSFGISSPAIVVPRVSLRFPSESAWRTPNCHSVRVVGVALYLASGTLAVPVGVVLGEPLPFVTATVSFVAASFIRSEGIWLSSNDAFFEFV